jgi:hypothetical protein
VWPLDSDGLMLPNGVRSITAASQTNPQTAARRSTALIPLTAQPLTRADTPSTGLTSLTTMKPSREIQSPHLRLKRRPLRTTYMKVHGPLTP